MTAEICVHHVGAGPSLAVLFDQVSQSLVDKGLNLASFWHLHFWGFAGEYLRSRYGDNYGLSAEQSLDLFTENYQTPNQLVVQVNKGAVINLKLPNHTSILIYPNKGLPRNREVRQGLKWVSTRYYRVGSGDCLSVIAQAAYGDWKQWPRIFEANPRLLGPDRNKPNLRPGQVLMIP